MPTVYYQMADGSLGQATTESTTTYTPPAGATVISETDYNTAATAMRNARAAANAAADAGISAQADAAFLHSAPTPADHGLITWTGDPAVLSGSNANLTAGQIYLSRVRIPSYGTVVSNIKFAVTAAQVGGTAGQNFAGLYDSSGNRLAVTADTTTVFSTTGEKTVPLTAPVTVAQGFYYVAWLSNQTTTALGLAAGGGGVVAINNMNLTPATGRFISTAAGNTSLPASITLSSTSFVTTNRWAGLT